MSKSQALGFSVIHYRPNLSRPNAKPIPLGVVLEIITSDFVVMGIIARTSLTKPERDKLDAIMLRQLEDPAKYIEADIIRCAEESPASILQQLAAEHEWSLQFTQPSAKGLSSRLAQFDTPEQVDPASGKALATIGLARPLSALLGHMVGSPGLIHRLSRRG